MADCKECKGEVERPVDWREYGFAKEEHYEGCLGRKWGQGKEGGGDGVGKEEERFDLEEYSGCRHTGSANAVSCNMDGEYSST